MKIDILPGKNILDSMMMAVIPIAICYWIVDSILNIFFYNKYNVLAEIFGPDLYAIYTRVIVLCILVLFGSHAQASINKLRSTRDALRASEQDHRAFIENLNVGVYRSTVDSAGRFVRANRAVAAIFGYPSVAEFMQATVSDVFPNRDDRENLTAEIIRTGYTHGREIPLKRRDGSAFWASFSAATKTDEHGEVRWIDAVIEDITDRKMAEEALRTSEEKYRQLVNHAPAGIYEVDLKSANFLAVNEVMCELTGYSRQELLSMKCYDVLTDASKRLFFERLKTALKGGTISESAEFQVRKKNGAELWTVINTRYHREFGKPRWATVVAHDISELKRAEEEKRQLQYELYRAQKMEAIGTLAGGVAHDFNNLLMGIQGHVSLMTSKTDYMHPHFNHLLAIENYIKSAADLTTKLLGFAQGGKFERKVIDLGDLARDQIQIFGQTRKNIRIHEDYQSGVWNVEVDPVQIKQVLLNLIVNALQAMPDGGDLTLRTQNVVLDDETARQAQAKPGKYVKLSVADTGVGMDKTTMQRVFEPFFTTKKLGTQKGIGLGLASAYGIIKNHNGLISVHSELGKGSTFTVFLPASQTPLRPERQSPRYGARMTGTILAIEEEPEVRNILEDMLKRLGFNVLKAKDAKQALDMCRGASAAIDLAILDGNMSPALITAVLKELRKTNPDVKSLISSAGSLSEQQKKIASERAAGVLPKPFSLMQLSANLREVLDQ
jgi:two-component system cell cycle sensor histidine kinase/response regulator CckA